MEETVGDEVAEVGAVDGLHLRSKESEFTLKPGSSSVLQSHEMVTPGEDDYNENTNNFFPDRIGSSEHASARPRFIDDAGVMVEELTVENYDGGKLGRIQPKQMKKQWQHLYQLAGGSGISSFNEHAGNKEKGRAKPSDWEDGSNTFFSEFLDQKQQPTDHGHNAAMDHVLGNDDKGTLSDAAGGIRTKILSKSGFSEYFIKSSLRGKGMIHKGPSHRGSGNESGGQARPKSSTVGSVDSVAPLGLTADIVTPPSGAVSEPRTNLSSNSFGDGISLREWLEAGRNNAKKVESLHIFRQVLDIVDSAHSQGVALQDLRPSHFKLLGSYQVVHLGSSVHAGVKENVTSQDIHQSGHNRNEKRPMHPSMLQSASMKKQKMSENVNFNRRWPQFPSRSGTRSASENVSKEYIVGQQDPGDDSDEDPNSKIKSKNRSKFFSHDVSNSSQPLQVSLRGMPEEKWYSSPELFSERGCTFASNIYCLGVLLFELLGSFDSGTSRAAAMLDLHHRILPPAFLSEYPKEAGFCLWLLHPEASSRPTTRQILQSEFIKGIPDLSGGELLPSIEEEDGESELLLYFLLLVKEQKQKDASKLVEQIQCIEGDIKEVKKRQPNKSLIQSSLSLEPSTISGNSITRRGDLSSDSLSKMIPGHDNAIRLMSNIRQLENPYFSMRSSFQLSDSDVVTRRDGELLKSRENWSIAGNDDNKYKTSDRLGGFFDGLCKYARYSKFRVRGILRNGDFNNSFANVISALSFDRDEDYLASGGVSKKIKIFEFQALFNDSVDIHYPVIEMTNKSKLTGICWNTYVRNYLASTDYDGIVKLWDASTGQDFSHFTEHSERAWSVDFSHADPMKLVSGSDDRMVKLWSINEKNSLCTIRNNANVCCVQFSADSSHMLAFSSSDYKTYCYDLRNISTPWCILAGHGKAVSYAKFLDAGTLVTASTDNTLKVWDLNKTSSHCLSRDACILTLRGHTNEKNFVGLSVADGYIACGSETNEVFAYYKSLPMPITSHKFGSIDPISGKETEDDNGQFVSNVCWRRKSNMVVAANSTGCIKLLQMV
ncbi:Protein SPA1-RELATED 2 [Forsythia ovata]|uniref:Protein SPA1-RELATED 2 n=1 Tax=Forsythia ovata TaxID=205694 RepID=A0ABD1W2C7_9LAMI